MDTGTSSRGDRLERRAKPSQPAGRAMDVVLVSACEHTLRALHIAMGDAWPRRLAVSYARGVAEACALGDEAPPDAYVLDLDSAGDDGIAAVERLACAAPRAALVAFGADYEPALALGAIAAGAQDCLDSPDGDVLVRAVRHGVVRMEAERHVRLAVDRDALTGLVSRGVLEANLARSLARSRRAGNGVAVAVLDLDRFARVNDGLGHEFGDDVLRSVAGRLVGAVRDTDSVARLGGDGFGVVLEDVGDEANARAVGEKLLAIVARPFMLAGHRLQVTASAGIATPGGSSEGAGALLEHAHAALARAKATGGGRHELYSPRVAAAARRRQAREAALRRALDNEELRVHYQPRIGLADGRLAGVEALVRWQRPGASGLLAPGGFVPLAERNGLIVPIGDWVLRTACRQARDWEDAGYGAVPVSVNVSACQLEDGALVDSVDAALAESGVDPGIIELELTETALLASVVSSVEVLAELRSRGLRVAIDDFGTGYCSLAYLRRLPVDTLKIDGSFIRNIRDRVDNALIGGIIGLARTLHLRVVAEGVETIGQLEALRALAPDEVQGHLFSRPLPAALMAQLLRGYRLPPRSVA